MADQVLYLAVRGVTDLLMAPGLVNLDFADIRAVMAEMGRAMVGTGEAVGSNRAIRSAEAAMRNPLLENASIAGARGLLINITGGDDLTLYEVDQAANCIREEVGDAADIIFGSTVDTSLSGRIRVSVVATGLGLANPTTRPAFPIDALETTEESQESLEPVPLQGAGPHFTLGPEHRIKLTVPPEVDDAGNLISQIEQLLPLVRRTAANSFCKFKFERISRPLQRSYRIRARYKWQSSDDIVGHCVWSRCYPRKFRSCRKAHDRGQIATSS
jgi:hypothetical protein